jgi:putative phosphoribosyl transferase
LGVKFSSRQHAGEQLGRHLRAAGVAVDVVLGLPRGGVVVAAEVARALDLGLDVLVVRKIGHPQQREYAVGAIAEPSVVLLDREAIAETAVHPNELDRVIAEEWQRLRDYQAKFHLHGPPDLAGRKVLIVDDGLATGATAEAAVLAARERGAASVVVAVPAASTSAFERLSRVADRVLALTVDPGFTSVGRYYWSFPQTSDEEVLALLPAHA